MVQKGVDFGFGAVGMKMEAAISGEHGGEACPGAVVEDVNGDAEGFGIGQFVADPQGGSRAFRNHNVCGPQPGSILFVDGNVAVFKTFHLAQGQVADMLCKDDMATLDIPYDALVQVCILPAAADRSGEIHFPLFHLSVLYSAKIRILSIESLAGKTSSEKEGEGDVEL